MLPRFMLPGFALVLAGLAGLAGFAGLIMPSIAQAGNGIHPRTPVLWEPEPMCMTVVDRTVDAKLSFNYTIPYEDLRPVDASDEVEDSRRHQFIAFCHGHSVQQPMPVWLSVADYDIAMAKGIVDMAGFKSDDILEQNPEWQDCFSRITADEQRRTITFAEASKPVVWDTTGVPAGAYIVSGYTWEPAFNIWSTRPGVVKVIDDPDPAKSGPALAILNRDEIRFEDEPLVLTGCFDAMDGSTITGYWAATDSPELDWKPFGADTPVSGDSFELSFLAPAEAVGGSVALKIEIVDPMDRKYTAHMLTLADILPGSAGESGECSDSGMSFIGMPGCEGSSGDASAGSSGDASDSGPGPTTGGETTASTTSATGAATSGATATGTDTGAETQGELGDGGCGGCALGGGGLPAMLIAPWLLWASRRRRA